MNHRASLARRPFARPSRPRGSHPIRSLLGPPTHGRAAGCATRTTDTHAEVGGLPVLDEDPSRRPAMAANLQARAARNAAGAVGRGGMVGTRTRTPLLAVVLAAAVSLGLSGMSVADEAPRPDPGRTRGRVAGDRRGREQHTDPTRYDYLPPDYPGDDAAVLQSARGFTFLPAFKYSASGLTFSVPGAQWIYNLTGTGLSVTNQRSNWGFVLPTSARLCNCQVAYQNGWGKTIYSTRWSPCPHRVHMVRWQRHHDDRLQGQDWRPVRPAVRQWHVSWRALPLRVPMTKEL